MNKVVHFFPIEKFTDSFVSFINRHFKNNYFFINENSCAFDVVRDSNVSFLKGTPKREVVKVIKESDMICVHQFNVRLFLKYFFLKKKLLKKVCWIVWGSDLYEFREKTKSLKGKLKIAIKRYFIKRINSIGVFASQDAQFAKEWFGFNGTAHLINYPSLIDKEAIHEIYLKKKTHKGIRIIVGNSATDTNRHEEILRRLATYPLDDATIFLPLSYGDDAYRKKIVDLSRSLFKEKAVCLLEYMAPAEYGELLSSMDIAFFNNNRQQANGNIQMLLYLGAKVYLNKEMSTWDQLKNDFGLKVYDIADVGRKPLKELCYYDEKDFVINHKFFEDYWGEKELERMWEECLKTR